MTPLTEAASLGSNRFTKSIHEIGGAMRVRSMLVLVAAVSLLFAPTLAAQTAGTQTEPKQIGRAHV